jgi:tetratricopeptide (TPR) repeat protein
MTANAPKSAPSLLDDALALREDGDLRGAVALLLKAAGEDGLGDVEVVLTLAKMLAESDQLEQAERWFNRAMALAPDDLAVQLAWGTFLGQAGRLDDSRDLLASVGHAARDRLAEALSEGEQQTLGHILSFLGSTEVNLARACLEAGDLEAARALVVPWLSDPEHWPWAQAVFEDLLVETEGDPIAAAREGLSDGQASPSMVLALLEERVAASPPDFAGLDPILARADALFTFDWRHADPAVAQGLAGIRRAYGRAVMKGEVERDTCRHLDAPSRRALSEDLEDGRDGLLATLRASFATAHPHVAWRLDPEAAVARALAALRSASKAGPDTLADVARVLVRDAFRAWWRGLSQRLRSGEDVASARLPYLYAPGSTEALRDASATPPARVLASSWYTAARADSLASLEADAIDARLAPWLEPVVRRFVTASDATDTAALADGLRELWRLPQGEYVFAADGADGGPRWPVSYPDHGRVGDLLDALGEREAPDGASLLVWRACGEPFGADEVAWFTEVAEAELRDAMDAGPAAVGVDVSRVGETALRIIITLA